MKRLKFIIPIIILTLVILGFAAVTWYQDAIYNPISDSTDTIVLSVQDGETIIDAAQDLQKQQAFKSIDAFRIYLRLNSLNPKLLKGDYQVPKNLNVPDLLAFLAKGPRIISVKVTLPEGLRYDEIADLIEQSYTKVPDAAFKKADFLAIMAYPDKYQFSTDVQTFINAVKTPGYSLEGFLFPDTYNLGADATALDVANLLISTKLSRLAENNISYNDKGRLNSFYEVMTLASIVEREATGLTDMKMVADVLLKRLEHNIVLGTDATSLYPLKRWTPGPNSAELQLNSPYNLRKFVGLPPTPIDNSGIDAITAVLSPTPNDYYYFITDKDGVMRYAVTLQQHQQNIQTYGLSGQ